MVFRAGYHPALLRINVPENQACSVGPVLCPVCELLSPKGMTINDLGEWKKCYGTSQKYIQTSGTLHAHRTPLWD